MIAAIYTPDGLIKKNRDTSLDKIAPRRTCLSRPSYVLRFSIETVYFRCLSRFEILLQNLEWARHTWLHLNCNIFFQIPFPLFRIILLFFLKIDFFLDLRRIQERLNSSNLDQSWPRRVKNRLQDFLPSQLSISQTDAPTIVHLKRFLIAYREVITIRERFTCTEDHRHVTRHKHYSLSPDKKTDSSRNAFKCALPVRMTETPGSSIHGRIISFRWITRDTLTLTARRDSRLFFSPSRRQPSPPVAWFARSSSFVLHSGT